jgi:hypothetical protein
MDNRTLIIALTALGVTLVAAFVAIILFYNGEKALAIAGLVTVAGLVIPNLLSLKTSTDNAVRLERVDRKVDENTAQTGRTHDAVNGQMEAFRQALREMTAMKVDLAAALALARGITIGREQAHQDPPPDEPKP